MTRATLAVRILAEVTFLALNLEPNNSRFSLAAFESDHMDGEVGIIIIHQESYMHAIFVADLLFSYVTINIISLPVHNEHCSWKEL